MNGLSYSAAVSFDPAISSYELPAHMESCLRKEKATNIEVAGNVVRFTVRFFRFVSNWNVLVPFDSGELSVDANTFCVSYRLNFSRLVVQAIIGITAMSAVLYEETHSELFAALAYIFTSAWVVGLNLAIGLWRFNGFMRRCMSSAPRR